MGINTRDPVWAAVSNRCEQGINAASANLETHGRDIAKTEFDRGQIAAFKKVLALAAEKEPSTLARDIGNIQY